MESGRGDLDEMDTGRRIGMREGRERGREQTVQGRLCSKYSHEPSLFHRGAECRELLQSALTHGVLLTAVWTHDYFYNLLVLF